MSFLSIYFLGEIMNVFKWSGIFIIIAGIALIGYGGKKADAESGGAENAS